MRNRKVNIYLTICVMLVFAALLSLSGCGNDVEQLSSEELVVLIELADPDGEVEGQELFEGNQRLAQTSAEELAELENLAEIDELAELDELAGLGALDELVELADLEELAELEEFEALMEDLEEIEELEALLKEMER